MISICRPKTHNCMVITGTVKNMCMGMPLTSSSAWQSNNSKTLMHTVGSSNGTVTGEDKALASNIFQNANLFGALGFPDLAILDAWEGEQGQGPVSGIVSCRDAP